MHQIIVGTKNIAKIDQLRGALAPLGIVVNGLPVDREFADIEEDGLTAQSNAKKKALAYAKAIGQIVLSMDNALYLNGLEPERQPGINVRRIPGSSDRPTDEEALHYYQNLIAELGGRVAGRWEFAICVAWPNGLTKETTIISPRVFVSQPSQQIIAGYPLESLQIDTDSEEYIAAMTQQQRDHFWQKTIGQELGEFVKNL